MKIGLVLPQFEDAPGSDTPRWARIAEMALRAEAAGFDSLWVVDHFLFQIRDEARPRGVWEGWSLLSALAALTARVELGTLVLATAFRNPALLAKMADTVDEISGGRLILGIGAGYHATEYRAFGYPRDYGYSRFAEALQIIHTLLRTGHVDFAGRFYSARDCELRPRGPRPHGPPIMIGSSSPKMLRLVARYADAWNGFYDDTGSSVAGAARLRDTIDAVCHEVGRDPATLERTITVLAGTPDAAIGSPSFGRQWGGVPITGSASEMADELRRYATAGAGHLQVWLEDMTPAGLEAFLPVLEQLRAQA
jgi:probable F420-dependent oxidoreductase